MLVLKFDALGNDHGWETFLEVQASMKLENEPEGVCVNMVGGKNGHVSRTSSQRCQLCGEGWPSLSTE